MGQLTTTGNSFASWLIGAGDQAASTAPGQIRYDYHAGFQDTWRISSRVTLDLGVRHEAPTGWHDLNGNYSSLASQEGESGCRRASGRPDVRRHWHGPHRAEANFVFRESIRFQYRADAFNAFNRTDSEA